MYPVSLILPVFKSWISYGVCAFVGSKSSKQYIVSQYRPLYRRKAEVQREEETVAIQYIVSQERNLQGMRKYIATRLGVSQDRSEAEIPAQKEMSCNTQDCIARSAREEILALRRTCTAIQKIVSQDNLLRRGGHAQRYIKSCCKTQL